MFNEDEDWNDEQDAQILSKTVLNNTQKPSRSTNVKFRGVGKKSLMHTLQTLGSVPEWTSDIHQQDSDSETEAAPPHSKKRKKRRKKRKPAEKSEEQGENGDVDQADKEEKPAPKKRKKDNKFGTQKAKNSAAGEKEEKKFPESEQADVNKPQNAEMVSRQQWKNKMKNKRKCKNKYRQNQPEEEAKPADETEPKEDVKKGSHSNNNCKNISQIAAQKKKKELEPKPQKKKETEEKQKRINCGKAVKIASESSGGGFKQKADEPEAELSIKTVKPELSKQALLKRQKLRKLLQSQETKQQETLAEQKDEPAAPEEEEKPAGPASFRSRMEQRLESARFRYINEVLYSSSSGEAKRMFKQDPQAFWIYHKGYTAQVQRWPANPVDAIISYIRQKPSNIVVADFGCGDCKIARSVKNKVHSFDLAATCELVTVCDMANVPLKDGSVDVAVFCLSLMGTNLADFLAEANRVLKMGGILKIAEVASRFDNVRNFITALANLGFKMTSKDTENTHFYSFEFVKTKNAPESVKKFGLQLKPCLYKKR
ncbi:ribosomal RNA-processing protein 8 [Mugil cephalus]|uniref:ribosomal RNA-processing protein 8 n=1 Tax=Mugil cephalus TaxID=48193 RepID=UPI001FB6A6C5|nr:ribosomal RNA-processing protein 8 [Mugil cephalus]